MNIIKKFLNRDILKLAKKSSRFVVGFEGNVSKKVKNGFLIKASGVSLGELRFKDLVHYDFNNNQLDNFKKKGSMELSFHSFLLEKTNFLFVLHTHPTNLLKILCSESINEFSYQRFFPDQVVFNGTKYCIVDYVKPGIELSELIKTSVSNFESSNGYFPDVILLKNHGLITLGKTINECLIKTEICEKSAEIFIGSKLLSNLVFLNSNQIFDILEDNNEKYRKNKL